MSTLFEPVSHDPAVSIPTEQSLRSRCRGELPLDARLEDWMKTGMLAGSLPDAVAKFGSPLNVLCVKPMARHAAELHDVAEQRGLDFRVFFARKSNKCLSFVDQAIESGMGIDTASQNELQQCLDRGASSRDLICTAAVKDRSLTDLCVQRDVCIAVDNLDELKLVIRSATMQAKQAVIALRLGGFNHDGEKLPTRFGWDVDRDQDVIGLLDPSQLRVTGVQFHLDGYDAGQRVSAIVESLCWIERLRQAGHAPSFVDMGGGFPISYLDDGEQWERFWEQLEASLVNDRAPITYRNHGLGLIADGKRVLGKRNSYPYYQPLTRAAWLARILDTAVDGTKITDLLKNAGVQLRCEPGRSLMDGCGLTVARVEFRKENADGDWLIGLAMNRTQCRTSSDDFLVDPILLRQTPDDGTPSLSMSGYLVGAYCTESELLSLRKLHFPHGIKRGDLIVFPNTAGYFMHFLESRSHQFPLAKNVLVDGYQLDPIDAASVNNPS